MSEFLLLFRGGSDPSRPSSPESQQAEMQKWISWMGDLQTQGKLVSAEPLHPTGRIVSGTKKIVTDGPFMEGKEMVGGFLLCKADSYEEAVEISNNCPILEYENGIVEVRQVQQVSM